MTSDNLYSVLAKKGINGDSELRYVDGELSHVNKTEAYVLDNYGLKGEEAVKRTGSGTINSETGLKQYEPVSAIATGLKIAGSLASIGSFLFGVGQAERNRKAQERINQRVASELGKQFGNLQSSRSLIQQTGADLLDMAIEESQLKQEDIFTDFLTESEKITTESDFLLSQTTMASSGGLMEALQSQRESIATELSEDIRGQELASERRVADILTDTAIAESNLDAQLAEIRTQIARYS